MNIQSPEYPMLKNYLELVADLPWDKSSVDAVDVVKVKQVGQRMAKILLCQNNILHFSFGWEGIAGPR